MQKGCELFVEKFLPKIKAKLAQILIKQYGLTQKDVAKALGISQAAVSTLLNKKSDIDFKKNTKELNKIIKKILEGKDYLIDLCSLCKSLKVECASRKR